MDNEIHEDVFIQVQTKYFPYRYVNEQIHSKCTLDMTMQATVSFRDSRIVHAQTFPKYKFSQSLGNVEG